MQTFVETDCSIEHEGRTFTAGGASTSDEYVIAYAAADGVLTDWHGRQIGTWRATSSWPIRSWFSDRMYQIVARVDGRTYTGRGCGEGMIYRGRRIAAERAS